MIHHLLSCFFLLFLFTVFFLLFSFYSILFTGFSEKSAECAFCLRNSTYLTPKCSNRTFSASAFQSPLWALQHSSSFL